MLSALLALAVCLPGRRPQAAKLCELLGRHFETEVFRTSAEALRADAAQICEQLGDPACVKFVATHFDALREALLAGKSVADACSSRPKLARRPSLKNPQDELTCQFCESLVSYVSALLLEGYAKPEIEKLIGEMCDTLPAILADLCKSILDQSIDDIIDWLEQGISEFDICVKIGLCPSSGKAAPRATKARRQRPSEYFCDLCRDLVEYIEVLVLNGTVGADLEALVAEFCGTLPYPLGPVCQSLVDQWIEAIVADIEAGIAAFDICAKIGVCATRTTTAKIGDDLCDYCLEAVDGISDALANGSSPADIQAFFDALCQTLPSPISALCTSFVDQSLPSVIQKIQSGESSQQICVDVGLCATTPGQGRVLRARGKLLIGRRPRIQKLRDRKKF